jgi:hypothetical protein
MSLEVIIEQRHSRNFIGIKNKQPDADVEQVVFIKAILLHILDAFIKVNKNAAKNKYTAKGNGFSGEGDVQRLPVNREDAGENNEADDHQTDPSFQAWRAYREIVDEQVRGYFIQYLYILRQENIDMWLEKVFVTAKAFRDHNDAHQCHEHGAYLTSYFYKKENSDEKRNYFRVVAKVK